MVEVLKGVAPHVAAFRVSGEVTKTDYETIVVPVVDSMVKTVGRIHFLLLIDTDISNFTAGAAVQDIWVGLKHFTKWHRMAIVTDQQGVQKFTDAVSFIAPGEAKGFAVSELEQAKKWVAE